MMRKNTKYKRNFSPKLTIISLIIFLILVICSLKIILGSEDILVVFISSMMLGFLVIGTLSSILGSFIGFIKGKIQIIKENKYIKKMNPYIYYRELPNSYGIGVNSLLMDSTIENHKDIVAVILDLCARKYLKLIKKDQKYIIQVLNSMDENLLNNEKYILNLIINNSIKKLNYNEWYMHCMKDGINLGLYNHKKTNITPNSSTSTGKIDENQNIHMMLSGAIGILFTLFFLLRSSITEFIEAIGAGLMVAVGAYFILLIPFGIINMFLFSVGTSKKMKDIHYINTIENNLVKTSKGVEELHKLYSFRAFLNDFGKFVDKSTEEVVLWDRYLSFAQVFGLTEEIMSSGYEQLVKNASFTIDSLEDINLSEIEVN